VKTTTWVNRESGTLKMMMVSWAANDEMRKQQGALYDVLTLAE